MTVTLPKAEKNEIHSLLDETSARGLIPQKIIETTNVFKPHAPMRSFLINRDYQNYKISTRAINRDYHNYKISTRAMSPKTKQSEHLGSTLGSVA